MEVMPDAYPEDLDFNIRLEKDTELTGDPFDKGSLYDHEEHA